MGKRGKSSMCKKAKGKTRKEKVVEIAKRAKST